MSDAASPEALAAPPIERCPRVHPRKKRGPGYSVEENAVRWGNYHHVLAALFHGHAGHLLKTPHIDAKILLGTDIWDFAQWIEQGHARIPDPETGRLPRHGRLRELRVGGAAPPAPDPRLAAVLDTLLDENISWHNYLAGAYLVLLPKLADAWVKHLKHTHGIADEPSVLLLKPALKKVGPQIGEMAAVLEKFCRADLQGMWLKGFRTKVDDLGGDLGALEPRKGAVRKLEAPHGPLELPKRDPGFPILAGGDPGFDWKKVVREGEVPTDKETLTRYFHQLCDAELTAAELVAAMIHRNPWMPWACAYDLSRQLWDEIRHFELVEDNLVNDLGGRWGQFPVSLDYFAKVSKHDLIAMLWLLNREMEGNAMPKHRHRRDMLAKDWPRLALTFDHLFGDEGPHVGNSAWAFTLFDQMKKLESEGRAPLVPTYGYDSVEAYVASKTGAPAY
jgi:hypothetical protein